MAAALIVLEIRGVTALKVENVHNVRERSSENRETDLLELP